MKEQTPASPVDMAEAVSEKMGGSSVQWVESGEEYTKDGPLVLYTQTIQVAGHAPVYKRKLAPVETTPFVQMPAGWRNRNQTAFCFVASAIEMIQANDKRTVPLLFEEIQAQAGKQQLKELERMGVIGTRTVQFFNQGKAMGGRKIVWLTPLGRGIVEELIQIETRKASAKPTLQQTKLLPPGTYCEETATSSP